MSSGTPWPESPVGAFLYPQPIRVDKTRSPRQNEGMTTIEDLKPNRDTDYTKLADQELAIQFMLEDREMSYGEPDDARHWALNAEINRRFGPNATENSSQKAVAWHMSSDDIVRWAVEEWDDLRAWFVGDITMENWEDHYHAWGQRK